MNRSPTKATPERHQISEPLAPPQLSPQPQRKPSMESGLATLHASIGNAAIATSEPPTPLAPATGSDVLAHHATYGNSAIALAAKRGEFDSSATQRPTQPEF